MMTYERNMCIAQNVLAPKKSTFESQMSVEVQRGAQSWMRKTVPPLVGYPHMLFLNINSFNLPLSKAEMKHNNTKRSSASKIHLDDNVIIGTPLTFLVYETYFGIFGSIYIYISYISFYLFYLDSIKWYYYVSVIW